jgi:hypothetical protein
MTAFREGDVAVGKGDDCAHNENKLQTMQYYLKIV